jgi:TonB-dependent SusC/RagA subfamily outer membrane receptor
MLHRLLSVNVEDIDTNTVIKDAAASAIWGANGANGVIQITTSVRRERQKRESTSLICSQAHGTQGLSFLHGDDLPCCQEDLLQPVAEGDSTTNICRCEL